ncbi:hypothetical protein U9K52_08535 [Chryseobacterium sp. MHB01]|nr:hypothetical protein [Chryseobacterium sp. MHB01]MEA1848955.1 hypothetical protein [Chryseobacterium sp. MHB01]
MNIKVDQNAMKGMSEKEKSTYLEHIAKTAKDKKDRELKDKKVVRK